MKSRVKTYTRKETGWMCEEVMDDVEKCVNSNGIVILSIILDTFLSNDF